MTTALGTPYHPTWAGRPPHMSPEDYAIWQRWRQTLLKTAKTLYFDVAVGSVPEPPAWVEEPLRSGWIRLNQRRIDLVVDYGDKAQIVELRFDATPNAIGRLLMYALQWAQDNPLSLPTGLALVTNQERPDMRALCERSDIYYVVI